MLCNFGSQILPTFFFYMFRVLRVDEGHLTIFYMASDVYVLGFLVCICVYKHVCVGMYKRDGGGNASYYSNPGLSPSKTHTLLECQHIF